MTIADRCRITDEPHPVDVLVDLALERAGERGHADLLLTLAAGIGGAQGSAHRDDEIRRQCADVRVVLGRLGEYLVGDA
jgi:hypothetical protein